MKAVELTLLLTLLLPSTLFAGYLDAWHKRDTNYFSGICFGNGLFVAVGEQGKILTSRDGQSWMPQSSGVSNDLTSVTYGKPGFGPGKFVALGNRSWVLTSSDGTNWARQMFISAQLNEVSYSSDWDLFVAVATQFYTNDPNAFISFDGTNWDEQKFFADTCPPGPSYLIGLRAITFGNDTFVAVGDTCTPIFTYNIAEWVDRGSKQEYFRGVAFGNGTFVAVGVEGPPYRSTNGINWTMSLVNTNKSQFDLENYLVGNGITFGNGTFVVANNMSNFLASSDGILWRRVGNIYPEGATKVAYGNGTFVAIGQQGIFQSDSAIPASITAPGMTTNHEIKLELTAEIGRGYRLQASSNLLNWQDIFGFTNLQNPRQFTDAVLTNGSSRFYRAVTP